MSGRSWVLEHFWRPAHQWRTVAKERDNLCSICRGRVWGLEDWDPAFEKRNKCADCAGLRQVPILVIILNLPRRGGKTFNVAAFCLSEINLKRNRSILMFASGKEQSGNLFEDNYVDVINNSKHLAKRSKVTGQQIYIPETKSRFRYSSSSHKRVTGGGNSVLILDEARDIPPRTAVAAFLSTRSEGGIECPHGHVNFHNDPSAPSKCPACGEQLRPWYPLVLIISSSGIRTNTELDWFNELVEEQSGESGIPHESSYVYRSEEVENPAVQEEINDAYEGIFSKSEHLRSYLDTEIHNIPRTPGNEFIGLTQLNAVTDHTLANLEGCSDKCFAFLDTSHSGDLTSLVFVADSPDSREPWQRLYVARVDRWDPKKMPRQTIDPEIIQKALDRIVPKFPNLLGLYVDVRGGMLWAKDLVRYCRDHRPGWGQRVSSFTAKAGKQQTIDRDTGWALFEQRILARTIRLPKDKGLEKEIRGVTKKLRDDGTFTVVDRNRDHSHAEVSDSIAICCWLAWKEATRRSLFTRDRGGGSAADAIERSLRPVMSELSAEDF